MTHQNIILALKDQMPFRRFVRNLLKGHLIGLFSKRSHYTTTGIPKVKYNTKATASRVAKEMMQKHGNYFSNYKCPWCGGFHIGKNSENK